MLLVFSFFTQQKNNNDKKEDIIIQSNNDIINNKKPYYDNEILYEFENNFLKLKISNLGAKICHVEIKNVKKWNAKPLILLDNNYNNKFGLNIVNDNNSVIDTNDKIFTCTINNNKNLQFQSYINKYYYIEYNYNFENDNSYLINLDVKLCNINGEKISLNDNCNIAWQYNLIQQEKDIFNEKNYSKIYYSDNNFNLKNKNNSNNYIVDNKKIKWISFKQHFFTSALIVKDNFLENTEMKIIDVDNTEILKIMSISSYIDFIKLYNEYLLSLQFYFGPCKLSILKSVGYKFENQINLGWGPLKIINKEIIIPFFNILEKINLNHGMIIFIITLLLKIILFPLNYSAYSSQTKMKIIKPQMDIIKKKYKSDPYMLQQEYIKLYRTVGINPLNGCLPMLLQIPILLSFFYLFPSLFELRQKKFLWINDLSSYDDFIKFNFEIPYLGNHISLMCLLMTITTVLYAYSNNQINKNISNNNDIIQYIGYSMPLLFLIFLNNYPSGLNYYYLCSNLITFIQQIIIFKITDEALMRYKIKKTRKKIKNTNILQYFN